MTVCERLSVSDFNTSRLKWLVSQFEKRTILVVGDLGVDRYVMGSVERISPEAPVPIVAVENESDKLGLAANVADNIRALDGEVNLVGVVGDDVAARDFRKLLKKIKVSDTGLIVDRKRQTVRKERIVSERQQLLRIDYENPGSISAVSEEKVIQRARKLIDRSDAVILQDYAKGLFTEKVIQGIVSYAKRKKKMIAADPNAKQSLAIYSGADLFKPNAKEAEALSGIKITDDKSLVAVGAKLMKVLKANRVAITRGKDGVALFTKGQKKVHLIPTQTREVYDVSGAGDTVVSVLTLALASGANFQEAAFLANIAAGVEVSKRGTATVPTQELLEAIDWTFSK